MAIGINVKAESAGFKIVMDAAGELPAKYRDDPRFSLVPMKLRVGEEELHDDGTLDQVELLEKIAASPEAPGSACPSPADFADACAGGAERIYLITVSERLSGSYQSAAIGAEMFLEEHPEAKTHVFNSKSTSVGETLVLLKILELEKKGLSFEEVIEETEKYIDSCRTFFVLDNLETLRKNGRLSGLKGVAAKLLSIKPICASTEEGEITQLDAARGTKKALAVMIDYIAKKVGDAPCVIGISHCNCPKRMDYVRHMLKERLDVKIFVTQMTGGLSSLYANDGGIIVVV